MPDNERGTDMTESGKKDKRKQEDQKKAKLSLKEKRQLKRAKNESRRGKAEL
jgi:hypothetical protein